MRYLFAVCLIFFLCNDLNASEHAYGGIPSNEAYIERQGYIIQFDAAVKINGCIYGYKIETLNVAGSRASKDPKIYKAVRDIIEVVIQLNTMDAIATEMDTLSTAPPKTVAEAVERLLSEMKLKDKTLIAKMDEDELSSLHLNLGTYIRNKFRIWSGNEDLMNSCRDVAKDNELLEDTASAFIVRELWLQLQKSHALRVVKK